MKKFDPTSVGPLQGVRVIDLSRLVAGNLLSAYLADFGADVIKIEREGVGDDLRNWCVEDQAIYWKIYGRNKRSMVLNLKLEKDLEVVHKLVKRSQIFIENFAPGVLEKLGLAPEQLLELNPALVIVRISGWGLTGPF
jgi:crotonobetainyl-CoA:carnitine CoA-transferase CaiB-like acyl-CoA transferase